MVTSTKCWYRIIMRSIILSVNALFVLASAGVKFKHTPNDHPLEHSNMDITGYGQEVMRNRRQNELPPGVTLSPEQVKLYSEQQASQSSGSAMVSTTPRSTLKMTVTYPTAPKKLAVNTTDSCDFVAYYCHKAYETAKVCGRAAGEFYKTFDNYCAIDYINCKERANVWLIAHMGECVMQKNIGMEPPLYEYHDDYFMDDVFVIDEIFHSMPEMEGPFN